MGDDSDEEAEQMRAAYEKKKKDLAKFKRNIENKEKHEAKIAKMRRDSEVLLAKKKEEEAERVEKLKMERLGKDTTAATNNVDTAAAYESFAVMDVDSSGRISMRELERFLGGEAPYYFEATFYEPDVGITFQCNKIGVVEIKNIEEKSPADYNPEVTEGLQLLKFGDDNLDISKLPKFDTWNDKKKCEETLRWLEHIIKDHDKDRPYKYTFLEPKYIFTEYNNILDIEIEKAGMKSITIPEGSYNTHEEMVLLLQQLFRSASPKLGKLKVAYDRDDMSWGFESNGSDFKFAFKSGPNRNNCAGPILGFSTSEDTEWDDEHRGKPRSLDLGMMITPAQLRIVVQDLVKEVDDSANETIEFDEYLQLYSMYLADKKGQQKLVDKVVERFLSKEQKKKRVEDLEEKKRLQKRRAQQRKAREKQKKNCQGTGRQAKGELETRCGRGFAAAPSK